MSILSLFLALSVSAASTTAQTQQRNITQTVSYPSVGQLSQKEIHIMALMIILNINYAKKAKNGFYKVANYIEKVQHSRKMNCCIYKSRTST